MSAFTVRNMPIGAAPRRRAIGRTCRGRMNCFVHRLAGVVIEQRDALTVMAAHDGPETLHYVDPPYLPETRSIRFRKRWSQAYRHDLTEEDHERLLSELVKLQGMVVVSGYASRLYDRELAGWRRLTIRTHADGARERTEVLWLNPNIRVDRLPLEGAV